MNKTRTVTTVFEYDEHGKVVKETRTEHEYEWEPNVPTYSAPYVAPTYPQPWYSPSTTWGGAIATTDHTITINGTSLS